MIVKSVSLRKYVILALYCLIGCTSSEPLGRQARTFQWPSFLFGGGSDATEAPETPLHSLPEKLQQYPVWRFHRYNGVRLEPVPLEQVPELASKNIPVGLQTVENRVPQGLEDLVTSLNKIGITNIPSLKDASILLGTSTDKETVDAILELASTPDGLELIKSYLSTTQQQPPAPAQSQQTSQIQHPIVAPYQYPSRIPLPAPAHSLLAVSGIPSNLDRAATNLDIINNAAVKPATGLLGRIGSFFTFGSGESEPTQTPEPVTEPARVLLPTYPKLQPGYQYLIDETRPLYDGLIAPPPSPYIIPEPVLYPAPAFQDVQPVNGFLPYAPWYNYPTPLVNSYGAELPYTYPGPQGAASDPVPEVVEAPAEKAKEQTASESPQRISPYDFHATGKLYTPNKSTSETQDPATQEEFRMSEAVTSLTSGHHTSAGAGSDSSSNHANF